MYKKEDFPKTPIPVITDDLFRLTFDPIEANLLATILQDCNYQLYNVGKIFEAKHLRFPELISAEKRGRSEYDMFDGAQRSSKAYLIKKQMDTKEFSTPSWFNVDEGVEAGADEGCQWVEKLVEASGFLENMYINVLIRTQQVIEDQKSSQEKSAKVLEKEGIRMKTFELSKIIVDRENLLNQAASQRVECILDALKRTISATASELRKQGTFEELKENNKVEMKELEKKSDMVKQELVYYNKCKNILDNIFMEKSQGWGLMKEREEQVASLKEYLKEQKVLKSLEINYVKKFSEAKLDQAKKLNVKTIEEIHEKEGILKKNMDNDKMCNKVMEGYLKREMQTLQDELVEWTLNYEFILEDKTLELKRLKDKRAKDHEWLSTLKKRIVEYEQVIEDEKRMVDMEEKAQELLKLQHKNATKIQAWWRGMQVRRCLGAYKKKKGKKGKKT